MAGVNKFSKNLGPISKFSASQKVDVANYILETPQISEGTVKKKKRATWRPRFVHPWYTGHLECCDELRGVGLFLICEDIIENVSIVPLAS
jgi:hypothetical protein